MGVTRIVLTMLCLLVLAEHAHAQAVDVAVFGPISAGAPRTKRLAAAALAKANVGTAAAKQLDLACAASTECLAAAGAEVSARQALAVTIAKGKFGFVLVDVAGKAVIGKRDVRISDRKIKRELGRALRAFLDEAPTERAKALFTTGNRHYELGEFTQALEVYKQAYRVKALPAFQFNIAQCHRKLGQHHEAIQMYQAYLVGVPDAQNKALVDSLIAESRAEIAAAEKAARDAEQAKLDAEKKKAEEARLAAEAARKAKEAEAAAEAERRRQIQAKLDAERQRELDKTYNRHPARKWMIATGVIGAATAGVGGYFAMRARNRQSAFDDRGCGEAEHSLPEAELDMCREDIDQGRKDARLANILIGAGGAVVLGSLIVYIIDPGNLERPKERANIAISPTSVQVVVRW
jgi:tetratricopeptide (TPR) repeat protein